jgi:hypothetical protein
MRCTKCGFISFDFNQVCPKCNRGLADEQKRFNLPSFRPDPPMLLGRLLGESNDEPDIDIRPDDHFAILEEADHGVESGLDDSLSVLTEDKLSFENEEELDVVSLVSDEHELSPSMPESEPEEIELDLGLDDISMEEPEEVAPSRGQDEEEPFDLLIESDDLTLDESSTGKSEHLSAAEKETEPGGKEALQEEEISLNLDELSFEDLEGTPGLESDLTNKTAEPENRPVAEFNLYKDRETMDAFYLDSNAEGLTKEIDMKKFRKDGGKGDNKPK